MGFGQLNGLIAHELAFNLPAINGRQRDTPLVRFLAIDTVSRLYTVYIYIRYIYIDASKSRLILNAT